MLAFVSKRISFLLLLLVLATFSGIFLFLFSGFAILFHCCEALRSDLVTSNKAGFSDSSTLYVGGSKEKYGNGL